MKINVKFILVFSFLFIFTDTVYGQNTNIEKGFVVAVKKFINYINVENEENKNNPRYVNYHPVKGIYFQSYNVHSYQFEYDIKKTDSITSTYIGIAYIPCERLYEKVGKTQVECINAPYKEIPVFDSTPGPSIFIYHHGKWIYKESKISTH